jgi:hypothetical protein
MKFKHNDRVTCEIDGTKITDARISIDKDGTPFICQNEKIGMGTYDKLGYKYSWSLKKDFTSHLSAENIQVTNLRPFEKTWDTLEVGDEIVDKGGSIRTVLGICGRVIFVSYPNDKDSCLSGGYTKKGLIARGFTIVSPKVEEEVEELTMEELCKELGRTVKIKK